MKMLKCFSLLFFINAFFAKERFHYVSNNIEVDWQLSPEEFIRLSQKCGNSINLKNNAEI